MMNFKIKSLLIILTLSAGMSLSAQELSAKLLAKVENDVTEMTTVMGLSDTQKEKLLVLQKEFTQDKVKIGKAPDNDNGEYKEARLKIQLKYNAGLSEICSKEQIKKWKVYLEEKKKNSNAMNQ